MKWGRWGRGGDDTWGWERKIEERFLQCIEHCEHKRCPESFGLDLELYSQTEPTKQIIPRRLSEDNYPMDEVDSAFPPSTPATPTTPSKTFTLPLNPFQRNVTPSKSLDSGLDEVDGGGVAGTVSPRTPSTRIMRRRSNSMDSSQIPQVRLGFEYWNVILMVIISRFRDT